MPHYSGIETLSPFLPAPPKKNERKTMKEIERLEEVMKRLRAPDGCPWDREQTHETLCECLIGEAAEYLDAVEDGNDTEMREELGDLLMQVVMNSVMAEERGAFTFEDVAKDIADKMIARHPHVFGNAQAADSGEVLKLWDKIKQAEHKNDRKSLMDGMPRHMAMHAAEKMQKKAAKVGFDWPDRKSVLDKIREESDELAEAFSTGNDAAIDEELGDLMFAAVNLCRKRGKHPEDILAAANAKFIKRFKYIESKLAEQGKTLQESTLEEMDALWNEAKG